MRSLNLWTYLRISKLKLKIISNKIKVIRTDSGVKYYDRYDRSGEQHPRHFVKYLEKCGIVVQYTMLNTPSMNGVTERQNRILKDMVRSTQDCSLHSKQISK